MATRIIPSYLASERSVFEQPSEHGRQLSSDRDSLKVSEYSPSLRDLRFDEFDHSEQDFATDTQLESAGDDQTVSTFLSLFPHRNESVIRYSDFTEWREVSRFHFLSNEEILSTLNLDSKLKRGVRFDAITQVQVILIPFESPFQNIQSATLLKQQFKNLGITLKHYQYNNDWYFYLFMSSAIDSRALQAPISKMLSAVGFSFSESEMTVCAPDTSVPLPVQPGFAWINDRGVVSVRRDEISLQGAVALFVSDFTRCAVDGENCLKSILSGKSRKPATALATVPAAVQVPQPAVRPDLPLAARLANVSKPALRPAEDLAPQAVLPTAMATSKFPSVSVSQTTISLLESVGMNVAAQDRIACFSVFEENAKPTPTPRSSEELASEAMAIKAMAMKALAMKARLMPKLEPAPAASDADYLRKLNQALRHP